MPLCCYFQICKTSNLVFRLLDLCTQVQCFPAIAFVPGSQHLDGGVRLHLILVPNSNEIQAESPTTDPIFLIITCLNSVVINNASSSFNFEYF